MTFLSFSSIFFATARYYIKLIPDDNSCSIFQILYNEQNDTYKRRTEIPIIAG
jgi:hypothetical protein